MSGPPLLSIRGLSKSYAAPVLRAVDLDLHPGEVHALMGANGAGKSTLARIVAGLGEPDSGAMELDGVPYRPGAKHRAEALGVQIVQQELTLLPTLTVAENLFLDRLPTRFGLVRFRALRRDAARALARVGLDSVDPETPTSRLGVGEQQLVEIARSLERPCRVLILDEPTAALTAPQVDRLFENIARLKRQGAAIVYISHRLDEVRRIADRISVLRDGDLVATRPASELDLDEAVRLMVGSNPSRDEFRHARTPGEVVLRVRNLSRGDRVRDVSFDLHAGEVLGVSGLVGSGRTELLRAIFGADPADSGDVSVAGAAPARFREPRQAVAAGLGLVPEDRKAEGLLLPRSIRMNLTLGRTKPYRGPLGFLRARRERADAVATGRRVQLACHSLEQPVEQLSGGNQQKVVVGRWLLREPRVMLFDEPTRGIDVAAKFAVYHLIDEAAARGAGVVVVSSEVEELLLICDRIAVISAGRLVATFARGEWSEEKLLAAAFQGYTNRAGADG
ncbi:sugar ABC transporter ATP-binding protein [Planctomyces sp. SH-PL62]|uniref:sugar ABC transporter ATP-binding protein n=1 Tax=Planctomyces sp. SH-PL62 TaxID=1636152 RepID=UPI00078DAE34|nr:sugar ABC transporter ATP-binding protein [Planctomyces sp. SH-PL62]AMV39738.1 Galactose/methyl galactoside import ATP-binding protein MglA [Planctomyces sp. SH-PL62]